MIRVKVAPNGGEARWGGTYRNEYGYMSHVIRVKETPIGGEARRGSGTHMNE